MIHVIFLVSITVIGSLANDGSIVDRCTPLAIIRPSEAVWVAEQEDAWMDISKILKQLKQVTKLSTELASTLNSIYDKNKDCAEQETDSSLGYRYVTRDKYSYLIYKEDVLGEILHKVNTYDCNLPILSRNWIERVSAFKANVTSAPFTYVVGLVNYLPGTGKTGNVQSLFNERLSTITDHIAVGIQTQPETPQLRLVAVDIEKFGKAGTVKDEYFKFGPTTSVKYVCVKKAELSGEKSPCILPFKERLVSILSFGIRTAKEISEWSNSLINKIDALPSRQVTTVTNANVLGTSYIMGSLIDRLESLVKERWTDFTEEIEYKLDHMTGLYKQADQKVYMSNHRNLITDHVTEGQLPKIIIKVDFRVKSVSGSQYVYGTVFGPDYSILNLQKLDRLPDSLGRTIIFNYLITNERNSENQVQVALERHPKTSRDCEMFGQQVVCKTRPASNSPDSSNCAKALLNLGTVGCEARQFEGKGLKETMAYCERDPRKYVISSREVVIEHKCPGDEERVATSFTGTLRFDDECVITFGGRPIAEVEEETDWTFDDIKKIQSGLDDTKSRVAIGEGFMIISAGSALFILSIMCCSYLDRNNCLCKPCTGNTFSCKCRNLNCFTCCKRCKKQTPLRASSRSTAGERAADPQAAEPMNTAEEAFRNSSAAM